MRRATPSALLLPPDTHISIHALREESDVILKIRVTKLFIFQSTLSVRRATWHQAVLSCSINDFNPRSPWGERPNDDVFKLIKNIHFNPRSPWGERLETSLYISDYCYFNPRSPWGERPYRSIMTKLGGINFNPRSPWGERRHLC